MTDMEVSVEFGLPKDVDAITNSDGASKHFKSLFGLLILFSGLSLIFGDFCAELDVEDNDDNEESEDVSLVGDIRQEAAPDISFTSSELDLGCAESL